MAKNSRVGPCVSTKPNRAKSVVVVVVVAVVTAAVAVVAVAEIAAVAVVVAAEIAVAVAATTGNPNFFQPLTQGGSPIGLPLFFDGAMLPSWDMAEKS